MWPGSRNHTACTSKWRCGCRSVPSGRVGSSTDAIFRSNEAFRAAVSAQEAADVEVLQSRMGRGLSPAERARIGTGQLRRFLEQLLQRRRAAVP